jgi:hypothetical protein
VTARDRLVILVVCAVAAVAGSWFLLIGPNRDQASKLGDQVKREQAQLDAARLQVAQGEAARSEFSRSYTSLVRLGEAVPEDDNVPALIYQLQRAASAARVDFQALTLQPGAGGSAPASTAKTSSSSAVQAVTATLPPGTAVGPAGFPMEPFTFTFQGNFFHLGDFFNRLEHFVTATNKRVSVSGRLMTLNAVTLAAAPQGFPQITATISATTYLVPASQGLLGGATPAGPASAPQTVSTTTSSPVPPAAVATP